MKLAGGAFFISEGADFSVNSGGDPVLVYTENSIAHVVCDPHAQTRYNMSIVIPRKTESIDLNVSDGMLIVGKISTGTAKLRLRAVNGASERLKARRVICSQANGSFRLNIAPSVGVSVVNGFGTLRVNLAPQRRGYRIEAMHGAGELSVNGVKTPRFYNYGAETAVRVEAKCGLGKLEINTQFL